LIIANENNILNDMSDKYVTQSQLEESLKKNSEELSKTIITEISETMATMMDRIDERFNKVETRLDPVEMKINAIEFRLVSIEKEIKTLRLDTENRFNELTSTIDGFAKTY